MSGEEKLVIFELNRQKFALSILGIQEIIRLVQITRIPSAPGYIRGIINFRGQIIPVISLSNYLNLAEKITDQESRIIVAEHGGNLIGLLVDSVTEVTRYHDSELKEPEGVINNEYTSGYIRRDDCILQVINLNKLLEQINLKN